MSSIHDITNNGTAVTLGPITVTRVFPLSGAGARANLFFLAKDNTGSSGFKIWGHSANCGLKEGDVVTLVGQGARGGLKREEYPANSGKWNINANDVRVDVQGGASTASVDVRQEAPRQENQAQSTNTGVDKLPLVMAECARATALYVKDLETEGFSRDEAIMLSQNAPSYMPLWWFGEKGLR